MIMSPYITDLTIEKSCTQKVFSSDDDTDSSRLLLKCVGRFSPETTRGCNCSHAETFCLGAAYIKNMKIPFKNKNISYLFTWYKFSSSLLLLLLTVVVSCDDLNKVSNPTAAECFTESPKKWVNKMQIVCLNLL